jgi:hypothetical protein
MLRSAAAPLVVVAAVFALFAGPPGARADETAVREVRRLVADGQFEEADKLLGQEPEEVRNDFELRMALAKAAARWAKRQTGIKRADGLGAARDHYGAAMKAKPDDSAAAIGAVDTALELADLWTAAKNGAEAEKNLDWAIAAGDDAFKGGVTDVELKAGVAALFAKRAQKVTTVERVDRLVADSRRAAELYAEAAPGHANEALWYGEAAYARMHEARFVNDNIPLEEEKRDEEAIKAAVELASKACATKGAKTPAFNVQLLALRLAAQWKVEGEFPAPFVEERPRAVEGLTLKVPKADGWKKLEAEGWTYYAARQFEGETKQVQLLIRRLHWEDSSLGGLRWSDIERVTERKYETAVEEFDDVRIDVEPVLLSGKKENKVWHYRIAGVRKSDGKQLQQAEWYWNDPRKTESFTYNLKILDFDAPWGLGDPDVLLFVESACGQGLEPKTTSSKKGKKKKRKKKKKKRK